jgi:hypothetical protein
VSMSSQRFFFTLFRGMAAWQYFQHKNRVFVCPVNKVLSPATATVTCFVSLDILLRYSSLIAS